MRTEAQIQAEIDAKTRELEAVRAEAAKRAVMPEDQRLAVELHAFLCHSNHTDGCGWGWEKDWTGYAHKRYLEKARNVLKTGLEFDTISTVIAAIR
jgi:hypothetical protein